MISMIPRMQTDVAFRFSIHYELATQFNHLSLTTKFYRAQSSQNLPARVRYTPMSLGKARIRRTKLVQDTIRFDYSIGSYRKIISLETPEGPSGDIFSCALLRVIFYNVSLT